MLKTKTGSRFAFLLPCALALLAGCSKCLEDPSKPGSNEPITNRRGAVSARSEEIDPSKRKTGRFKTVLIQPIESASPGRSTAFVHALYLLSPFDVAMVARILTQAPTASSSVCPPQWRIDLTTASQPITAFLSLSCGLIKINDKFFMLTEDARKTLEEYARKAKRSPTHKVYRLRIPVELPYHQVLRAIRPLSVETYLPYGLYSRNPFVRVRTRLRAPLPGDLTKLDQAARRLGRRAELFLQRYAQGLMDSRPEVVSFEGPYPVAEEFEQELRVCYEVKIYFRHETDAVVMRYHTSRLEMEIEEVTVPRYYRMDMVLSVKTSIKEVRHLLAKLPLKPPLTVWPIMATP